MDVRTYNIRVDYDLDHSLLVGKIDVKLKTRHQDNEVMHIVVLSMKFLISRKKDRFREFQTKMNESNREISNNWNQIEKHY